MGVLGDALMLLHHLFNCASCSGDRCVACHMLALKWPADCFGMPLLQTGVTNSADAVQLAELLPQRWGTFMHKG